MNNNERFNRDFPIKPTSENIDKEFSSSLRQMPSSSALYRSGQGLIMASDINNLIPVLKEQKAISGYHTKISYSTNNGSLTLTYEGKEAVTTVNLDIGTNKKTNKTAYKLFRLFMSLINESPDKRNVYIAAKEISKRAGYTRASSFNRAFDKNRDSIIKMGMNYYTKFKEKKPGKANPSDAVNYFSRLKRTEDNNYIIILNDQVNINTIFQFFTCYKDYAFTLGDNAFILYDNIMYLARQNMESIKKMNINGSNVEALRFTVSIKNICIWLGLPFNRITNPNTQIKDPINKALEEIEHKDHEYAAIQGEKPEIYLTVCCRDNCGIEEYLKNGYVEVILTGEYKDYFKGLMDNKSEKIKKAIKTRDKAYEKALVEKFKKDLESGKK